MHAYALVFIVCFITPETTLPSHTRDDGFFVTQHAAEMSLPVPHGT